MELLVFGDQTLDIQPFLKQFAQHRDNPALEDFLTRAFHAIRDEIHHSARHVRVDLPRFTCIEDIIFREPGDSSCLALEMASTCMYQIGVFICQYPRHVDENSSRALGICTGALTAAAVCCSRTVPELIPLGVHAIRVAFRIGILVADTVRRIESPILSNLSWLLVLPGLKVARESLDTFIDLESLTEISAPYISAYGLDSATVSGPPSSLQSFKEYMHTKGVKSQNLPIHGPYHAPHLYTQHDVQSIVEQHVNPRMDSHTPDSRILFSDGSSTDGGDFAVSIRTAVNQILRHAISWDDILDGLLRSLEKSGHTELKISTIGTKSDQILDRGMKQTGLSKYLPATTVERKTLTTAEGSPVPRDTRQQLAIIGMSGRFPAADSLDAFWEVLADGLDVHKPVPKSRWDTETHVDPTGTRKNTSAAQFGCWLDNPDLWDARFFNVSPREAAQIDPAQRLALMSAYEAIEQAGLVPDATPSTRRDRVGVYFGTTSNDWMETNSAQNIDTYFIPGGNRAFIPGRINYFFKFSGPSYAVDTACSSSLASIHLACNSLWRREIDTAIAGGTNVLTNPDFTAGLDRGHFLSRTGNCKTFDDNADGYCRGEGVGTVIIKRLEDAIADSDPILGVILSASTNHSSESDSITRPHVGAQREIMRNILNRSGTLPSEVSYVEMHGTGTQVGDAIEMRSVLESFALGSGSASNARSDTNPLHLGSAKANIGHGEAASGVSSLIKTLLMMKNDTIVPHCGIKTRINQKFPTDLLERNVRIASSPVQWKQTGSRPRKVVVNNFSAAGGNSAILVADAPSRQQLIPQTIDTRRPHNIAISAKTGVSLQGNLRAMLKYLRENDSVCLGKLSYTTTARRIHHAHRVMVSGSKVEELSSQIQKALDENVGFTRPKAAPKVVFVFAGQGAHYPGMGRDFLDNFSLFRSEIRRLDGLGLSLGFPSILPLLRSEESHIDSFEPLVVQLAGTCIQMALSKLWKSWNVMPTAVLGHSLGEYAALNASGVLTDADTIYVVGKRAQLLQERCSRGTHSMVVIKGSVNDVVRALQKREYEIACINSPTETVLAASNQNLSVLTEVLAEAGLKSTPLKVPYAFHSAQVDPILVDFETMAKKVTFSSPIIPIISPLDAKVCVDGSTFGASYLVRHAREPVNMREALLVAGRENLITSGCTVIDIGTHPAVSGMVNAVLGSQVTCLATCFRGRACHQTLSTAIKNLYMKGADISWADFHTDAAFYKEVVPLPAYSWDLKPYWIQYVNDWSLRKGDPPATAPQAGNIESTTVHRVLEESETSSGLRMILEADITRKDLSPLVQGHEVDGIPLCTPSVYADIALTLGDYLLKRYRPDEIEQLVDVTDMNVTKALILRVGAHQQLLQAHADADWGSNTVVVKFMSFDARQKLQEHSRCAIRFRDRSLLRLLDAGTPALKKKADTLRKGIVTGDTARFTRSMVYRAIRPLARFHDDYRAIDEIVLNSETLEASSCLSYGSVARGGTYHTHPAIIDSLTQSCGFTMNCNDGSDLDKEVFMNHGWGSFQIFEPLDMGKKYTTYTQMKPGSDGLWRGDVVVYEGDTVVAFFGQIAIQGVPRRVLKVILSIESGTHSQKRSSAANGKHPSVNHSPQEDSCSVSPTSQTIPTARFEDAMKIIVEESGLSREDFADGVAFADVGIDSLLNLTLSARIKDELDIDIGLSGLVFDYPTVGELKSLFLGASGDSKIQSTAIPTQLNSAAESTSLVQTQSEDSHVDRVLEIISEESGVAKEDFTDDVQFADAGIDSLLSLVVVSRLRDELGLEIGQESLLTECLSVADLKQFLSSPAAAAQPDATSTAKHTSAPDGEVVPEKDRQDSVMCSRSVSPTGELASRRKAVDHFVRKYTEDYKTTFANTSHQSDMETLDETTNIMVTGASGSLGSHLVDQLAQRDDVDKIICLNRTKANSDPYAHQQKAMRDKGVRSFDKIRHKLVVIQTDTSKPMLGLPPAQYGRLTSGVTHLIHAAWPMSAKRALDGFESQLQIMRNLIDFAGAVTAKRPASFKFSFQMVSSIGVVGHHGLSGSEGGKTIHVTEKPVDIDSVLPNGYSEAKWACERMLDETLHKHQTNRFRTMVVRLGQIAGSKRCGFWNPTEHFGFLIKSSQTLKALPDVSGKAYWTPVEDVAGTLADLVLAANVPHNIYHLDNPVGQSWSVLNKILSDALGISNMIPFEEWIKRVRSAPHRDNPAAALSDFFHGNYLRMSCGGLVLDVRNSLENSAVLSAVGPVPEDVIRKYLHVWREIGFIN